MALSSFFPLSMVALAGLTYKTIGTSVDRQPGRISPRSIPAGSHRLG